MSTAVRKAYDMARGLAANKRPWLEIQREIEGAEMRQGSFEPLYVGCESAPHRLRFVPQKQPRIISREFDEELTRIGKAHSMHVQMRCTGYNVFTETDDADGLLQSVKKALGLPHQRRLLRVLYLDKYGIELERPDVPGASEALEEIGRRLYGIAS